MEIDSKLERARHRNLVFTSAGDHSCIDRWLVGRRSFDLWVAYYGSSAGRFRDVADYYCERRAAKFQNLHFAYRAARDLFDRYDAVLVMDDDLEISGADIDRLFDVRERYDLWVLQPAFSPLGKNSWPITVAQRRFALRFTNFIEGGAALFRKDKLDAYMDVYDPELVAWGCAWWFLHSMGPDLRDRVAIVDSIVCRNPYDHEKGGREIDGLSPASERRAGWERIRAKYAIPADESGIRVFRAILRPPLARMLGALHDALDGVRVTWALSRRIEPSRRAQFLLGRLRSLVRSQ